VPLHEFLMLSLELSEVLAKIDYLRLLRLILFLVLNVIQLFEPKKVFLRNL